MKSITLEPEAAEEFAAAVAFYEGRVEGLGDDFVEAVDTQLARIRGAPRQFQLSPGAPRSLGVRRVLLSRFPFFVVYLELDTEIRVLAFAHQSRRPGYWRARARRRA